jgi:hypothetical protein
MRKRKTKMLLVRRVEEVVVGMSSKMGGVLMKAT